MIGTGLFSRKNALAVGYILAVSLTALALSALLHVPHSPEHWSADLRTAYLSEQRNSQHDKLALVYVTDKSLERFPYASPTDRGLLAELVTAIDNAGAKVLGLDFIFDRPTEPAKDEALVRAIRKAKAKIVLGNIGPAAPQSGHETSFEAEFQRRAERPAGHLFFGAHHSPLIISDDVVRTILESETHGSSESFALAVARAADITPKETSHYISWLQPPVDGSDTFLTLSAENILSRPGSAALPLTDLLKDRIVLLGGNFFDRDQHLTPFSVTTHTRYPGLSIHAQIIAQLIDGRALHVPGTLWKLALIVAAAAFGFWAGRRSGGRHLFVEMATVAALVVIGILAFRYFDLIFPYTGTLLAWLAGAAGGHYGRSGTHA